MLKIHSGLFSSSCSPKLLNLSVLLPNKFFSRHTFCMQRPVIATKHTPICPKLHCLAFREVSWSDCLATANLHMICISIFYCSQGIFSGHTHCRGWQVPLPETQGTFICIMRGRLHVFLHLKCVRTWEFLAFLGSGSSLENKHIK